MGLHRAGFQVVGFDIERQPSYPFDFVLQDAFTVKLDGFDAVWASPPCQAYSKTDKLWKRKGLYPDLVAPARALLEASGLPYIIENVEGAPLREPVGLCGEMFGLRVVRHRFFETKPLILVPKHPSGPRQGAWHAASSAYGYVPRNGEHYTVSGHFGDRKGAAAAMGIDWMAHRDELAQAIPPAYAEFFGTQLLLMLDAPR
jgi:DNA (cytosine-5)-methyltransferase 1